MVNAKKKFQVCGEQVQHDQFEIGSRTTKKFALNLIEWWFG